jgi:hypothetical protein
MSAPGADTPGGPLWVEWADVVTIMDGNCAPIVLVCAFSCLEDAELPLSDPGCQGDRGRWLKTGELGGQCENRAAAFGKSVQDAGE